MSRQIQALLRQRQESERRCVFFWSATVVSGRHGRIMKYDLHQKDGFAT